MYAIIDIGSNTIRLSLYQVMDGKISLMINKKVTAGLAGYIQNGHMSKEGIQRGEDAITELTRFLSYIQVKELFCFATAPLRGIDNAEEVKSDFEKFSNAPITILSGEEEAEIDFLGAKQNLDEKDGLIVDIGGGSTEFVYYADEKIQFTKSIPLGSLVMYRKYVKNIIPTKEEIEEIMNRVQKEMDKIFLPVKITTICGIGGTIRACGKILTALQHDKKKALMYTPEDAELLIKSERCKLTDLVIKAEPERVHTIIPGTCILIAVANYFHAKKIHVSKTGVREGYLMKKIAEEQDK